MTRALVLAATTSGSGKTLITAALIKALRARGLKVAAAKCGPDHIDPQFHERATGRAVFNLDPWSMSKDEILGLAQAGSQDADILLIEGVMGLFDGTAIRGKSGHGATADLARLLDLPVVLIASASRTAQSLAATALGFQTYAKEIDLAGVIANQVASPRHAKLIRQGFDKHTDLAPLLGCLPSEKAAKLPRRHLGLVQAEELEDLEVKLTNFAARLEETLNLNQLLDLAKPLPEGQDLFASRLRPLGQRIAIAEDIAFSFAYPHLKLWWRGAGAELLPFSPLANEAPDPSADAVYLPGGYPELHLPELRSAKRWKEGMHLAAKSAKVIYGECGGYMTLGESIEDAEGNAFPMLGLLPLQTSFAKDKRKLHLGYRQIETLSDWPLAGKGAKLRAHEFHYAATLHRGEAGPLFQLLAPENLPETQIGLSKGQVFGSFLHVIA